MTELADGDDGFLRMDQFSDAQIDGDELGDEPWYADVEPLGAAAWSRVLAGAVSDTDTRPELDDLVPPPPAEPAPDDGDPVVDEIDVDGGMAAHHDGWGGDDGGDLGHGHEAETYEAGMHEAGTHEAGTHEFAPHDAHGTPDD